MFNWKVLLVICKLDKLFIYVFLKICINVFLIEFYSEEFGFVLVVFIWWNFGVGWFGLERFGDKWIL